MLHNALLRRKELYLPRVRRQAFQSRNTTRKKFIQCCRKGRVILPLPKGCPQPLSGLLQDTHPKAKTFLAKIRNHNSAHAFASMGANISAPPGAGPTALEYMARCNTTRRPLAIQKIRSTQSLLYTMSKFW